MRPMTSIASILRRGHTRSGRTTLGVEVLTAGSAVDAVQQIRQYRPHMSVRGIVIPDVDGYQLLKQIRALGSTRGGSMSAIALTAFARSEDRTRAARGLPDTRLQAREGVGTHRYGCDSSGQSWHAPYLINCWPNIE